MTKTILGIHIGEHRIICTEAKTTGKIIVEKVAVASLPRDTVADGIILNSDAVMYSLSEIITRMEISTTNAVLNIPANLVHIKSIPTEADYIAISEDQLSWEMSHHINEPLTNYQLSHFVFPITTLIVATRKQAIVSRAQILERVGLFVEAAYPEQIALFNFLSAAVGHRAKQNIAFMNIEVPFSQVLLFTQGEFGYCSNLFTPPELFGIGTGKKTWREFGDDLCAIMSIAIETQRLVVPAFAPDILITAGRPIKADIVSSIAQKIGAQTKDFNKFSKEKIKIRPHRFGVSKEELSIVLGLTAHALKSAKEK